MASTGISGLGFFFAAYLVSTNLSVDGQAKYFMLTALVALQSAFEMGASQLLMSNLAYRRHSPLTLQDLSSELAAVLQVALRYAKICSAVYVPFFLAVYLMALQISALTLVEGIVLALASGTSMFATFLISFLEGLGAVQKAYALRFLLNVSRTVSLTAGLLFGAGTYAISASLWISSLLSLLVIMISGDLGRFWRLAGDRSVSQGLNNFSWRVHIFPAQWRLSVSWASSYVIYQGPIWLSFAVLGTSASACFGLSWAIFMGLSAIGASILGAHAAHLSTFLGSQRTVEALHLWKRKSIALLVFAAITGLVFIALVYFAPANWLPKDRVMDVPELLGLLLATLANQIIYCIVVLGRATGKELFHLNYSLWMVLMLLIFAVLSQMQPSPLLIVLSCALANWIMLPLFFRIKNHAISH
jgi:hypothetical protein